MTVYLLTAAIYFLYLFLPGFFFLYLSKIRYARFIFSYAISLSLLVIISYPYLLFGGSITNYLWSVHVGISALITLGFIVGTIRRNRSYGTNQKKTYTSLIGLSSILIVFSTYHIGVGPYTEIPSDLWKHIARVRMYVDNISSGNLHVPDTIYILDLFPTDAVYFFHALVSKFVGVTPTALVAPVTLVTTSIFLGTVYFFTEKLLQSFSLPGKYKVAAAVLAVVFFFISFGTATFSYPRYYAYFPTIFAFPLIYAAASIFLDFLCDAKRPARALVPIPIFLVVMYLVHPQEALLTIIMLATISLVRSVRLLTPNNSISGNLAARVTISTLFFLSTFVAITICAIMLRELQPWGPPHVINIGQFLPMVTRFPMDNPSFRFWDTLGIFGILVYLWYFLNFKTFRQSDFLTAGMVVPLLTNLNPLYAFVFLHFGSSTGLWRTIYLAPLPIVAAILLVSTCLDIVTKQTFRKKLYGSILAIALIGSILPIRYQNLYNRTSKIPSLLEVHDKSGGGLWSDLIEATDTLQSKYDVRRIITDEMTKFVLYAATRGQIYWWPDHEYFPRNRFGYKEDFLLSDFTNSLLVINNRNGRRTKSAEYARHWPSNVLDVDRHYPPDIREFVDEHPSSFNLLWSSSDIDIYMMKLINQ